MEKKTRFCFFVPKAAVGEDEEKKVKKERESFFFFSPSFAITLFLFSSSLRPFRKADRSSSTSRLLELAPLFSTLLSLIEEKRKEGQRSRHTEREKEREHPID